MGRESVTGVWRETKSLTSASVRVVNPRVTPLAWFTHMWDEQRKALGPDPWVYGLGEINRKNLQTILRYTYWQGLIGREMSIDELFIDTDRGDAGTDEGHYGSRR